MKTCLGFTLWGHSRLTVTVILVAGGCIVTPPGASDRACGVIILRARATTTTGRTTSFRPGTAECAGSPCTCNPNLFMEGQFKGTTDLSEFLELQHVYVSYRKAGGFLAAWNGKLSDRAGSRSSMLSPYSSFYDGASD